MTNGTYERMIMRDMEAYNYDAVSAALTTELTLQQKGEKNNQKMIDTLTVWLSENRP